MKMVTEVWQLSLWFYLYFFLVISGCATSTTKESVIQDISELNEIQSAFDKIVEEIYSRDGEVWHHGSFGNFIIYWNGGNNRGYCHEWQEEVFKAITPLVLNLNWQADKINVGVGTSREHHVVLVYDPKIINREKIRNTPMEVQAFVLDAWYHGRPNIYQLKDWLTFAFNENTDFYFEGTSSLVIEETLTSETPVLIESAIKNSHN